MFLPQSSEFLGLEARPFTFTYAQLRAATDDFSAANKLGEGGFGPVYKVTWVFMQASSHGWFLLNINVFPC